MVDLNANVVESDLGLEQIMGRHSLRDINDNGKFFVAFCSGSDLVIGSTIFPHKEISQDVICHQNQIDRFNQPQVKKISNGCETGEERI